MNFFKIITLSLFVSLSFSTSTYAADDATSVLKSALKKQSAKIVDYTSGCPNCVKEMQSRKKAALVSPENNQTHEITVLTQAEVSKLFNELKSNPDLPYGFPLEGCFARAHVAAQILESKGIICGKAFVEGDLWANTKEFGKIKWRYHVAPVVYVNVNGKNVPYILDPAVSPQPEPYTDWKKRFTSDPAASVKSEYFTNRFSYAPADKNKVLNSFETDPPGNAEDTNRQMQGELNFFNSLDENGKQAIRNRIQALMNEN